MKKILTVMFAAVFVFGFALGDIPRVSAQESEEFTLEEITVTAQKREQDQQKVPIAMGVVMGEEMKELGVVNLDAAILSLSSVWINEAGDGYRVSIRGISSEETVRGDMKSYSNAMPSVAVNTDGAFTVTRKTGVDMYDVERIEVLMGPQSTLYSSNSPGGIVNIVTSQPKTDKFEVSGKIEFGNYHNVGTEGMVNVPLSESTALRAAFITSSHDGYMSSGHVDANDRSVRGKLLHKPNEDLSITLTGQYILDQGKGQGLGRPMFIDQDDLDDPWDDGEEVDAPIPRDRRTVNYNALVEWGLGIGTFTFNAYTAHTTEQGTFYNEDTEGNEYTVLADMWTKEKGAEMRLASSDDYRVNWILGATTFKFKQQGFSITLDTPWHGGTRNKSEAYAFYGNLTYPVTDRFRATGGLRYSDDKNDGLFTMVSEMFSMDRAEELYYNGFDHKIGFEYDIEEDKMIYADWTTGYRVGSMGGATEPETLDAYTVGSKNRFLGNKLQVNASAYFYDYKNKPAECHMTDPDTGQRDLGGETQGSMRMFGVELDGDMILSSNDRLSLAITYQNAEFDKLVFEYYSPSLPDIVYTGESPTFTPDWTITAQYDHNFNLPNGFVLTAHMDARWQSEMLVNFMEVGAGGPDTAPPSYIGYRDQEAYHTTNAALIYAHPEGTWTVTGYVKNLENYAVKRSLMESSIALGPPRTYGIILQAKY